MSLNQFTTTTITGSRWESERNNVGKRKGIESQWLKTRIIIYYIYVKVFTKVRSMLFYFDSLKPGVILRSKYERIQALSWFS